MRLTPEELKALRELSRGSVRNRLNERVAQRFVMLGLARPTADGVAITRTGRRQADTLARVE